MYLSEFIKYINELQYSDFRQGKSKITVHIVYDSFGQSESEWDIKIHKVFIKGRTGRRQQTQSETTHKQKVALF